MQGLALAHSSFLYGLFVLLTTVAGLRNLDWRTRAVSVLLLVSWAVVMNVRDRLGAYDLLGLYALLHCCTGVLALTLLPAGGALWLAVLALVDMGQFGVHFSMILNASGSTVQLDGRYRTAIAICFTLELGCVWLAGTPVGRWWPPVWRAEDLRVDEADDARALA